MGIGQTAGGGEALLETLAPRENEAEIKIVVAPKGEVVALYFAGKPDNPEMMLLGGVHSEVKGGVMSSLCIIPTSAFNRLVDRYQTMRKS